LAPQVGSVVLLFFFYLTNFQLVGFIPKTVFSSLLLLAFIDMISSWFIKSFLTTKEKIEWLVVPLIIVLAFTLNLLQAVFLGIAMSTFLFVASFNRSGVVKYVASGLTIRSTIERPPRVARWLGQSANQIQILILQNYLFFGNASSILSYVTSMFEDSGGKVDNLLPPIPKVVILDLTLVTGTAEPTIAMLIPRNRIQYVLLCAFNS
jgi:MFS superfamily sulfate permease-like transporter